MFKTIVNLAALAINVNAADQCVALAMSGGGAKGAFEAGVLYGMYHGLEDVGSSFDYDVITGVSAGAINTMGMAVFPKSETGSAIQTLSDTWASLKDGDLYENWWFGPVRGFTDKSGIYNTEPLYKFIKKYFNDMGSKLYRKMVVASADVNSGAYILWDEKASDVPKAVVSSASIPFIFPNQHWGNNIVAMDGGTVYGTNLVSAINRCKEIVGDDESKITLDIVVTQGAEIGAWDDRSSRGTQLRFKEIKEYHDAIADIYEFKEAFPRVNFRYYVEPTGPLCGGLKMIDVSNSTNTWPMQMQGRQDGDTIVSMGEGAMFKKMDEWNESPELKSQYPRLAQYMRSVFTSLGGSNSDDKVVDVDEHVNRVRVESKHSLKRFVDNWKHISNSSHGGGIIQ